jgi:hypothetical protein
LASLSFVTHAHLSLAPPSQRLAPAWGLAAAALRATAAFPAPGDKLVLIMGACTALLHALSLGKEEAGKVGASICADVVMPALMYALIRANPARLLSQLRRCDRDDAFAHVRAHMGGEGAAELRQSAGRRTEPNPNPGRSAGGNAFVSPRARSNAAMAAVRGAIASAA